MQCPADIRAPYNLDHLFNNFTWRLYCAVLKKVVNLKPVATKIPNETTVDLGLSAKVLRDHQ